MKALSNLFMIKIRLLERKDKEKLFMLVVDFFKREHWGKNSNLMKIVKCKDYDRHLMEDVNGYMRLDPKKAVIFVVEDDGALVGYIYGRVVDKPNMVLDKVGMIEDWFIEKEYRGKGVGEMLWTRLMSWFKVKNCNRLELNVYPDNEYAIAIYHKLGFVKKSVTMTKKF
jgi:ribosomal protein S18 acetylase RimI-like enzyme